MIKLKLWLLIVIKLHKITNRLGESEFNFQIEQFFLLDFSYLRIKFEITRSA
jgi:hypothetical protein